MFYVLVQHSYAVAKPTVRTLGLLCMGRNDSFYLLPNENKNLMEGWRLQLALNITLKQSQISTLKQRRISTLKQR